MATRIRRRTLLLSGAVAALAAGGALAVSNFRKPSGGEYAFPVENLPVAAVPGPTDQPVEVVYCAGWDSAARAPVSPMSESVARAQDAAGGQYAAVLFVGGVARVVVEVCWSAHHAELWNVDDAGRRYRGVAYRRWPDGQLRLFEVRSWNYAGQDTPEFHGEEPTFEARVRRDASAAIETIAIMAVLSRSKLQTSRAWEAWPEQVRPPENVAVPAVGDWPRLAGMTGPITVRSGPTVVPATFPWHPPSPLRPRHVTEVVTDGARFRTQDNRTLTIKRVSAGTIRLPSGRLLVADPGWLHTDPKPLATTAPPGTYPVDVFQVTENEKPLMTAACRVTVTDVPVASWRLALRDGDQEMTLGDGEFFGNPVDTAILALVDHTGMTAYSRAEIDAAMADKAVYSTVSAKTADTDMIIVPGWSDGAFPVWLGYAENGALCCFVLDMHVPDLATAQPA
ncbi:DUF4241 domain-containing protein [Kibdelosporangium aridum]|uniref:DUF4241 domain-containing protein n=1 Tax=Kibdelosporangium aridum TaxID=2030 RepID=A0A428ZCD5_KIBAR|nr:DUF4241 domain-containing protein [Kibdelosporangium aridum]RSM85744.1 DUF4241 domain-containing protein [Kibdelosporangium aridum]